MIDLIGRPKKFGDDETARVNFKLPARLKASLVDYASSCGLRVSDVLLEYVTDLVAANERKIAAFRRQKNQSVKATFVPVSAAQVTEGGDDDA